MRGRDVGWIDDPERDAEARIKRRNVEGVGPGDGTIALS